MEMIGLCRNDGMDRRLGARANRGQLRHKATKEFPDAASLLTMTTSELMRVIRAANLNCEMNQNRPKRCRLPSIDPSPKRNRNTGRE